MCVCVKCMRAHITVDIRNYFPANSQFINKARARAARECGQNNKLPHIIRIHRAFDACARVQRAFVSITHDNTRYNSTTIHASTYTKHIHRPIAHSPHTAYGFYTLARPYVLSFISLFGQRVFQYSNTELSCMIFIKCNVLSFTCLNHQEITHKITQNALYMYVYSNYRKL